MRIVETLYKADSIEIVNYEYFYRLTETKFNGLNAYGIEVERNDYKNNILINIERDSVYTISSNENKVRELLNLLYNNKVSPIHFIDVIGEYVDKYVQDFDTCA